MMANARSVLRGVTCKDTRDTLEELVDQGWKPEHSRGGHIRLTHEDAAHPIISAKTPSTARGRLNLKADARRAIKLGRNEILSTTLLHSAIPPLEPANLETLPAAPSERMKKRWSKERRAAERAKHEIILPVSATPPLALASKLTPGLGQFGTSRATGPSNATKPAAAKVTAAPEVAPAASVETKTAAPVTAASADPKPKRKAPKVTAATRPVPEAAGQGAVPVIGADVMALAMRLLSGELQSFEITSDMVGMTLLHEGSVHLVNGAIPAPQAKAAAGSPRLDAVAAPAPKDRSAAPRTKAEILAEKRRDLLRTALAIDPATWMTHLELADLVEADAGYASRQSLTQSTKHLLQKMHDDGELEARSEAGMNRYRMKAR